MTCSRTGWYGKGAGGCRKTRRGRELGCENGDSTSTYVWSTAGCGQAGPSIPDRIRLEPSAPEADAKISENQSGATTYDDSQPPWCQGVSHDLPRFAAIYPNLPAKSFWRGEIQPPLSADPGSDSCL